MQDVFGGLIAPAVDRFAAVQEQAPLEIWDGVLGRSVEGALATLGVIELAAGSLVPEHRHGNEQLGVLVAGSLAFRIGEESRELRPGAMWAIPADVPHEVRVGPDGAVVVEVFAPRRDDWARLSRREGATPAWPPVTDR